MLRNVLAANPNWGETTAIATIVLAVLTGVLALAAIAAAVLARRGLRTAAEDLQVSRDATRTTQENADRQMEAEHRPLLIDVAPGSSVSDVLLPPTRFPVGELLTQGQPYVQMHFPRGHSINIDPYRVYVHIAAGWAYVGIPLRNVGRGLATIDPDDIRLFGPGLEQLEQCEVLRERVPAGESSRILCTSHYNHTHQTRFPHVLTLLVPYRDFLGGQLAVAYVDLVQREMDESWSLAGIKQVRPADIALPTGVGPAIPQR